MKRFNLLSSQVDRIDFEEMVRNAVPGMLDSLPFDQGEDCAWSQDGDQYAEVAFENFCVIATSQAEIDEGIDPEEFVYVVDEWMDAYGIYKSVFPQAIRDWQKEMMIDHMTEGMHGEDGAGYTGMLIVTPGGTQNGLSYNPVTVDYVSLQSDGDMVAYRQTDDATDGDWELGSIEDAVEEALALREQLKANDTDTELSAMAEADEF